MGDAASPATSRRLPRVEQGDRDIADGLLGKLFRTSADWTRASLRLAGVKVEYESLEEQWLIQASIRQQRIEFAKVNAIYAATVDPEKAYNVIVSLQVWVVGGRFVFPLHLSYTVLGASPDKENKKNIRLMPQPISTVAKPAC